MLTPFAATRGEGCGPGCRSAMRVRRDSGACAPPATPSGRRSACGPRPRWCRARGARQAAGRGRTAAERGAVGPRGSGPARCHARRRCRAPTSCACPGLPPPPGRTRPGPPCTPRSSRWGAGARRADPRVEAHRRSGSPPGREAAPPPPGRCPRGLQPRRRIGLRPRRCGSGAHRARASRG